MGISVTVAKAKKSELPDTSQTRATALGMVQKPAGDMPQFAPSQVLFNDNTGYGIWDVGHGREHIQFVMVLAAQTPAILLPDPDFLAILSGGRTRRQSMDQHQEVHSLLRAITGISGVDYTEFKLDDESDFYSFVSYHENEHAQIRQALGIVS